MEKYLGVKIIKAEPQFKCTSDTTHKDERVEVLYLSSVDSIEKNQYYIEAGYKVVYEDGYTSWSPKDVFEKAYKKTENYSSIILDVNTINGSWDYYNSGDCEECRDCKCDCESIN